MRIMTKLGVSAAAVLAGWVLAPFVSMRRHGTLDEQHSGELRLEALLAEAERVERVERLRPVPTDAAPLDAPAPRSA